MPVGMASCRLLTLGRRKMDGPPSPSRSVVVLASSALPNTSSPSSESALGRLAIVVSKTSSTPSSESSTHSHPSCSSPDAGICGVGGSPSSTRPGQTTRSWIAPRIRARMSCSTLGMSCSLAREPRREVVDSWRVKSGWRDM